MFLKHQNNMGIFDKSNMANRVTMGSNVAYKKDTDIPDEVKRDGHTEFVPELKINVFIRKGNTLENWLKVQRENNLISNTNWEKLIKKYPNIE